MRLIERMGEPARFGLEVSENPKDTIGSFRMECNLRMTEFIQFGERLEIEPFYWIVEAEKA